MEITTVLATKEPVDFFGQQLCFTDDDLMRMAETAKGIPITLDFHSDKVLSLIASAEYKNEQLSCTFDLKERPFGGEPTFIVPAVKYCDKKKRVLSLIECGITTKPKQSLESF